MDNEQEVSSIFSKLNVNAVEFVPSFAASVMKNSDPIIESESRQAGEQPSENNGTGKSIKITQNIDLEQENFCHIECRCES
jgi:hypothetical protein